MKSIVDMENLHLKFDTIVNSKEWDLLEKDFISSKHIFIIGNGGNLSIADHAAIDISRLTNKNAVCPGSGITATSVISDNSFEIWFKKWVEFRLRGINSKDVLILGLSCSVAGASSSSIINAMKMAQLQGCKCHIVCAQEKKTKMHNINFINQNVKYYHTSEVLSTMLFYQLIHCAGFDCPTIMGKDAKRKKELKDLEGR